MNPSPARIMAVLTKLSSTPLPNPVQWAQDYPVTFGVPAAAAGGAAVGMLYHLVRKATSKKYDGSALAAVAAGLGLGAAAGGAYAIQKSPKGIPEQFEKEVDDIKYDRQGPFRQALRAVRPLVPTRPGTHDYPADFKDVIKEPATDLPDTVALGGRVSPQEERYQVSSPMTPAKGLWRQGFEGGKPKEFFTLDEPLKRVLGPPKDSSSYTGSETLGSRSQYDYNNAMGGFFNRDDQFMDALKPTDRVARIGGHASSNPLSSVAGVSYKDILADLVRRGRLTDTDCLELQTCNAAGADIPNDVIKAGLGRLPPRITFTPPGATSYSDVADTNRRFIREKDKMGTRVMDRRLLAPQRVTTVATADLPAVDPSAVQSRIAPVIPVKATHWVGNQAERYVDPVLNKVLPKPLGVGAAIRSAANTQDYAVRAVPHVDNHAQTWNEPDLVPKLKKQRPDWFRDG